MTNGKGRSISEAPPAELKMAEGWLSRGGGVRHIPAVAKDTANLHGERTEGDGTRGATSVSLWGIELSVISGAGRQADRTDNSISGRTLFLRGNRPLGIDSHRRSGGRDADIKSARHARGGPRASFTVSGRKCSGVSAPPRVNV